MRLRIAGWFVVLLLAGHEARAQDPARGPALTLVQCLQLAANNWGISYVCFAPPSEAHVLPEDLLKILRSGGKETNKGGVMARLAQLYPCDWSVEVQGELWIASGKRPREIPASSNADWLWREVCEMEGGAPQVPPGGVPSLLGPIWDGCKDRMPELKADEVAWVPFRLAKEDAYRAAQALAPTDLGNAAHVVGSMRRIPGPDFNLKLTQVEGWPQLVLVSDTSRNPAFRAVLGESQWQKGSERLRDQAPRKPWGWLELHWFQRTAFRWSEALQGPLTLSLMDGTMDRLAQEMTDSVKLRVPDHLRQERVSIHVRDLPVWGFWCALSAASGVLWQPRLGHATPSDGAGVKARFFERYLSVAERMGWLQNDAKSAGAYPLLPYLWDALSKDVQQRLERGHAIPLASLAPPEKHALEHYSLRMVRTSRASQALEPLEHLLGAGHSLEGLFVCAPEAVAAWIRPSPHQGWKGFAIRKPSQPLGPRGLLEYQPTGLLAGNRARQLGFVLGRYGTDEEVPIRFWSGSPESASVAPALVGTTIGERNTVK